MGREGSDIHDEAWVQELQKGSREHYERFVQHYGPYLYRTVFTILRQAQDAEDVTQDVLIQIYRSLPNYRGEGFRTWITRIAVNRSIDFKRKKARRPEELGWASDPDKKHGQIDRREPYEHSAEEQVIKEGSQREMQSKINDLPENYRSVVQAFYMEEQSYEQIAKHTGLEKKSVESRLYRARQWMKRHWRKGDF